MKPKRGDHRIHIEIPTQHIKIIFMIGYFRRPEYRDRLNHSYAALLSVNIAPPLPSFKCLYCPVNERQTNPDKYISAVNRKAES